MPTKVFNLSITNDEIINKTHARMAECFHESGGEWKREYMPRTAMVFLHDDEGNSVEENDAAAHAHATKALSAYWQALQGTLDPAKVEKAANNALCRFSRDDSQANRRAIPSRRSIDAVV